MTAFETAASGLLWDATAVSNAFFCEYMPAAPEGYVKVYLYGLMYAHSGLKEQEGLLADMAQALHMSVGDVERAMRYWERCRLVERTCKEPAAYRFLSVQQMLVLRRQSPRDEAYESFAQAVYAAFGDRRKLHGGETVLAYEWVEELHLPAEVVLMLIQHMIATRGVQFGFQSAQKIATEMADQDVRTVETAEAYFAQSEAARKGARSVLRRLGSKGREPSDDEVELYVKWTGQWGFEPKAVLEACRETTRGSPTFAYLDKILEGVHTRSGGKATTQAALSQTLNDEKSEIESIRQLLRTLGQSRQVVNETLRNTCRPLFRHGHELALLAAERVSHSAGEHTLDKVESLLTSWEGKGITDVAAARTYVTEVDGLNRRIRGWMESMDKKGGCTDANRTLLRKWQNDWHMPDSLMDLAAEYAAGAERPMPYMDRLLSSWRQAGIVDISAARQAHEAFVQKQKPGEVKKVADQQYEQRQYRPGEFGVLTPEQIEELTKE